jgi:hypothetical protein
MSLDTLNTLTPKPAHVAAQPGSFAFTSPVGVWADAGAGDVAALVQAELGRVTGLAFQPADAATRAACAAAELAMTRPANVTP